MNHHHSARGAAPGHAQPRRRFLQGAASMAAMLVWPLGADAVVKKSHLALPLSSSRVDTKFDLTLARTQVNFTGTPTSAITLNGTVPGPLLRMQEGHEVAIALTNRLDEVTAAHWHGLKVPNNMDGVPGVTFPGIKAGETFNYRFNLRQSGTYWYHSHAILQEPAGFYAPLIIDPQSREPFGYDREYVVMLSEWVDTPPAKVLANLKKVEGYYNDRRQTLPDLYAELKAAGSPQKREAIWSERMAWARMRMDPTDATDGGSQWQFLMQGQRVEDNWTALFAPGERIRLRLINASAMNFFDVSIPGLELTVVQADGQNVRPVRVRELRMGNGETYDVIVQPTERKAYTLFAATSGRIGFARGTLAPELGMEGEIPPMGQRPVRTMDEMAGTHGGGHASASAPQTARAADPHAGHGAVPVPVPAQAAPHAMHGGMKGMEVMPGMGSTPMAGETATDATAVGVKDRLAYADLEALTPLRLPAGPAKKIDMRLTGDMTRYIWSINDKKLSQATFFEARVGERLEIRLINETMMEHPMHMHGAFFVVENGKGERAPLKHTVIVKPGETITVHTSFDEAGPWVFHCHLFYHAAAGMIQAIVVK
ncbi:copper resistance system multicopper oxidase [Piscinibacter gummiphilus]|jgi:CopA family copper-resistance protein|uniref:Copper resistance system multicopper oxidase n=1 Tax=Piscinibacter gummiphilus TaxID=946333 RepID=A0ABZ0D148_9BURK|nr:copper resistance system multicopper oxidase [Piscinibacter gummiphilus]WOB10913.1 copper resistance system multicopper oxidase [Piscinibacter gummiphilus]